MARIPDRILGGVGWMAAALDQSRVSQTCGFTGVVFEPEDEVLPLIVGTSKESHAVKSMRRVVSSCARVPE